VQGAYNELTYVRTPNDPVRSRGQPHGGRRARPEALRVDAGCHSVTSSSQCPYAYISRIEAGPHAVRQGLRKPVARSLASRSNTRDRAETFARSMIGSFDSLTPSLELRLRATHARRRRSSKSFSTSPATAGDRAAATRAAIGLASLRRIAATISMQSSAWKPRWPRSLHPHRCGRRLCHAGPVLCCSGAADRAARLFERCLEEVREAAPSDYTVRIRFAALLSYALSDAGEYDGHEAS